MNVQEKTSKTENSKKQNIPSYIVLCFFAAFNVCFFVPIDIFLANASDIAFPIKPLALFMGLITLAVFAALFFGCLLTRGKANSIFRAAVFGVAAALYIQGNFLAVNMGLLDGSRYELPVWKAILNTVIWLAILAAPFVILKKLPKIFDSMVSYVPAAIIVIQIITIGITAYIRIPEFSGDPVMEVFYGDTRWINTAADLDLYSVNKNLIVIVADEYDSRCFDSAVEKDPGAVSEFDGFTYYANTVGKYTTTTPSISYILSGSKEVTYDDRTFLDTVSENFRTNFYTGTVTPPAQIISEYSDNVIHKRITLGDTRGYAGGIYKISLFRCVPEVFKPLFRNDGSDIGQELNAGLTENLDLTDGVPEYSYFNYDFYTLLPHELRPTEENVFKFVYFFGLHEPHGVTPDLEPLPEFTSIDFTDEAVAVNKILNGYLKTLKEHGMYDNSDIFIMADHGHYDGKKFPLLLYKPAGQTAEGISVSNAPISYDDMFPTLVKLAGGDPGARTVFDIGEDEERVRYFGITDEEITGSVKDNRQINTEQDGNGI